MAKALKVFVVLLLVFSLAALALGIMLFQQREQMKGRTQKLEQAVVAVAGTLTAARDPYIEAIQQEIDANALMAYESIDGQLGVLRTLAENRYEELFNTHDDLKKTTDELTDTRLQLAQTRQELADARAEVARLTLRLEEKQAELARANQQIADLEQQVAGLEENIQGLNAQIAKLGDEKRDMKDEIIRLEQIVARYERDDPGTPRNVPVGLAGRVLVVNPEWNFVVLDIGSQVGLAPNAEMLVHRADRFLGKVRVSDVKDNMAIADIAVDWQRAPIEPGDVVFYPGS